MKLDQAIKILKDPGGNMKGHLSPSYLDAVQLGIEALKREQILRHEIPYDREGLLPGETKE
ncbi:hypothetical protein ES703_77851 [subsurface metagenome]